jgi:hypothetical protein
MGEFFVQEVYDVSGSIPMCCCGSTGSTSLIMDRTPAYSIFLGLLIGAIFGFGIGVANGDTITGMQIGAMAGIFIGWLIAALALKK